MMYLGRGLMLWELYISPKIMTREELDFLATTLAWGKNHAELLATSQMILGSPFNKEVYGYMHLENRQGLLFLRNPAAEEATATLQIERDVMLLEPAHDSCRLNAIFPQGKPLTRTANRNSTVRIQMEPDSVVVLEVNLN